MSSTKNKDRKIMDEVRDVMRLHHYSIHTERSYCDWIKRFIRFHKMKSRDDLKDGELKIEEFLTHPAVDGHVSPSTQNQAMNAPVFLYRKVLKQELDQKIDAVRAKNRETVPVVMTREEVVQVIGFMEGIPQLGAKLLYGSGVRITQAGQTNSCKIQYWHCNHFLNILSVFDSLINFTAYIRGNNFFSANLTGIIADIFDSTEISTDSEISNACFSYHPAMTGGTGIHHSILLLYSLSHCSG